MVRRFGSLAALLVVTVGLLGACSGSDDTAQLPASTQPSVPVTAPSTTTTTSPELAEPTVPADDDFAVERDPFAPQG